MNSKVFFSESESKPGVFEKNKKIRLKNNFVPPTELKQHLSIKRKEITQPVEK